MSENISPDLLEDIGIDSVSVSEGLAGVLAKEAMEGASRDSSLRLAQKDLLIDFIDKLPNLNELDKYWARNDAEKLLAEDVEVKDLVKKYKFYNKAAKIRNSICEKAPDGKGSTICNIIDSSILNVSSDGRGRDWKLKELREIEGAMKKFKKEQDLVSFVQRQNEVKDSVAAKILMLFDVEFADKFQSFQEAMGAPRFWALSREMSPAEFPNFTTTFNFRAPRDFLKKLSQKSLPEWPDKLRKALQEDAKEILDSEVFEKNKSQELRNIARAKNVAEIISRLLDLKKFRDIESVKLKKEKEFVEKQKVLKEEKINADKERKERQDQARQMQEEKKAKEVQKKENEKKKEEEAKQNKKESGADLGFEKQIILKFYEKVIEHAEAVIAICPDWGVDPNDESFWGQEGIKNRPDKLQNINNGAAWENYKKYNAGDPNIPSNARGGFRFRWLNVNTGSRMNSGGADAGIKYLQRYKDSGYMLCALAGGFSIDWSGSDSPTYTPVRFLEKVNALKNNLVGSSTKK